MLLPLNEALEDPGTLQEFLAELGWEVPATVSAIGIDPGHIADVANALIDVIDMWDAAVPPDDTTIVTTYGALIAALAVLAQDVYDLRNTIGPNVGTAFANASSIAQQLPKRLFDYLVIEYLLDRAEPVCRAFMALGVFELTEMARDQPTFRSEHVRRTIRLDRLKKLVTDPAGLFVEVYGWGTPAADLNLLLARLYDFGDSIGLPVALSDPPLEKEKAVSPPGTVLEEGESQQHALDLTLFQTSVGGASAELGLSLFPIPPEASGGAPGLALGPFANGSLTEWFTLDRYALWLLKLSATLDVDIGIEVIARPGKPPTILFDPFGAATQVSGSVIAEIRRDAPPNEEIVILGTADGSGIRAKGVMARVGVDVHSGQPELIAEIGAEQGRAGVSLAGSDSFLAKILPEKLPDIVFDLGASWSSKDGVRFRGGAGLEFVIGAGAELGPIKLEKIYVAVGLQQTGLELSVALAASAALGPIAASVDQVGIRFVVTQKQNGNLGPFDASVQFKPPKGVGFVVDASVVKGGGYVYLDFEKGEYAGVLELSIKDTIQIKAIGLLTTRLPGGQPGFSLLLILTAQFSGIQLGYGFVLTGIGGLIGINRTMVTDVLRSGIRNRTVDSIMFPPDPVKNANKIISDLKAIFPPVEGRFVFGPMLELGWGTPVQLIKARLGVFIELPPPIRLAILGQLKAVLPTEDAAVVKLNLDVIGIIEFEKKSISLDATIYDSMIAAFAVSGDMALRLNWGDQPNFALSVGGLNPRFEPPPGFPTLRRLTLSMGVGENPRLSLETYMALTSNSAQFGARLQLRAEAGGFAVQGHLAFDALFIFTPFSFVTEISAGVDLLRGNSVLMSIRLDFTLSGPTPWHANGKATLKVLFFSVSVRFDAKWGEETQVALPSADAKDPLLQALREPNSWSAALPQQTELGVSFAETKPSANAVLVHPLGRLTVKQSVVPLNQTITKFGNAAPSGANHFTISKVAFNGSMRTHDNVEDFFAPAQFKEMSDAEALTSASFKLMDAGAAVGARGAAGGTASTVQVLYSTQIIDNPLLPSARLGVYRPTELAYFAQLRQSAAELSPVRRSGEAKFAVPGGTSAVDVSEVDYVIASTDDLTIRDDLSDANGAREMAVRDQLEQYLAENPHERASLQVVPRHEAVNA